MFQFSIARQTVAVHPEIAVVRKPRLKELEWFVVCEID